MQNLIRGMGSGEKRFDFSTLNDYPPIRFLETRLSILPDWTIIGGVMWPEFTDSWISCIP